MQDQCSNLLMDTLPLPICRNNGMTNFLQTCPDYCLHVGLKINCMNGDSGNTWKCMERQKMWVRVSILNHLDK